jgi:hypothetical protein
MTKKELITRIKELGGSKYSKMNKDELQRYLTQLEAQKEVKTNKTTIKNKEEIKMTNKINQKEFQIRLKAHEGFTTYWKETDKVTKGQMKLYNSLLNNYEFEEIEQLPTNAKAMSLLLLDMENKAASGEVAKKNQAAKSDQPTKEATDENNRITFAQMKYINDLAVKLNKVVAIPYDKKEASELITALLKELSEANKQAATTTEQPAIQDTKQKKQSLLQRIVGYFKRG